MSLFTSLVHRQNPRFKTRIAATVLAGLLSSVGTALADNPPTNTTPAQIALGTSQLSLIGRGVATYLWFDVYDAALYAPARTPVANILATTTPKTLILQYRHAISVADITKASWKALDAQYQGAARQQLKPKIDALQAAMQDVKPGDTYKLSWQPATQTAAALQPASLSLSFNGKRVFASPDAELAQAYFGIWLGEPPLSPELKAELLGNL